MHKKIKSFDKFFRFFCFFRLLKKYFNKTVIMKQKYFFRKFSIYEIDSSRVIMIIAYRNAEEHFWESAVTAPVRSIKKG